MAEHGAYIIHPTYRTINDGGKRKAIVHLWGRLQDGRSFLLKKPYRPYFFIPAIAKELANTLAPDVAAIDIEKTELKSMSGLELVKVYTDIPSDVPKLREVFEKAKIECLEADIRFAYRAMMDWKIKSTFSILSEPSEPEGEHVDVVFNNPQIGEDYFIPQISTLSFDIETNTETGEVYCISCYGLDPKRESKTKKLIVSKNPIEGDKEALCFDNEAGLIAAFTKTVIEWDPDLITGWNVIDFDLAHLIHRAEKNSISLPLSRDGSAPKLRIQTNFFRSSSANITGRVVIDGIQALKGAFVKLPNYKLATAARKYTDEKKLIEETGKEKCEEINRQYHEDKRALLEYNLQDAVLAHKILENSGILELTIKRSMLVGMPPDRVNASIAGLDSLYLRELHNRGFVAPSAGSFRDSDRGVGGFVMEPKSGIYRYVIVLDFKSLYPSIMRTFNIDPLMYVANAKESTEDLIIAPNGAGFKRERGIIPGILDKFWAAREEARKNKDELARFALKIHMNSMYGVLASPNCRFFNRQVGNAITSFAQYFIKLTAEELAKMGYEVIYGDTDSVFVDLKEDNDKTADAAGKKIEKAMNKLLSEKVKADYNRESLLELEFEKTYVSFVIPKMRGAEGGAKKRYAGLMKQADGSEKITFTGMEFVRRDWTDLAKEFQMELYRRVFYKEEVTDYVRNFVDDINAGKHDHQLVYRKALRKNVEEYTKTTPPHVKAARLLKKIEGSIIEYVMTTQGPEPIQNQTHPIDYEHYIKKQVKPIADAILDFFGTSFDQLLTGQQKSLFDF